VDRIGYSKNEKDVLGIYVTGHPLVKYENHIKTLSTHTTQMIKEANAGTNIKIGCLIIKVDKKVVKNTGKKWARIIIEDFEGTYDASVFSSAMEKFEELIKKDNAVFIEGDLMDDANSDKKLLSVKRVRLLDEVNVPKVNNFLHVILREDEIRDDRLHSLKDIIAAHRGSTPVYIHMFDENHVERRIRINDLYCVDLNNDLKRRLKEHSCVKSFWEEERLEQV